MKLFHTKSLLACDIPKSLTSEGNSARILTNLTDDRFKACWREFTRGNDSRGFPLGKILRKETNYFPWDQSLSFIFDQQMKHKPKMILQESFLFFLNSYCKAHQTKFTDRQHQEKQHPDYHHRSSINKGDLRFGYKSISSCTCHISPSKSSQYFD